MRTFALAFALLAAPAGAQTLTGSTIDTANLATKSEVQAARAAAEQAAANAAIACVPGTMLPKPEAVAASAGTASTCKRSDEVPVRISRTVSGITGAGGQGAVTWPEMMAVPKLTVTPYVAASETLPPACFPVLGTVSTTGATIRCYKTRTILGLGLIPYEIAPSGVQFDVLALPGS